jgi:hypothetical protein
LGKIQKRDFIWFGFRINLKLRIKNTTMKWPENIAKKKKNKKKNK